MWDDKSNVKLNTEKFEKICRTCLSDEFLSPISQSTLPNGIFVTEVLSKFIATEDLENEQLPQQICTICIDQLNLYMNFKSSCEQNEMLFKSLLESRIAKTECGKDSIHIACDRDHEDYASDTRSSTDDNLPLISRIKAPEQNKTKPKAVKSSYKHRKRKATIREKLERSESCEENGYTCRQCSKSFRFKYKLVMHVRVHTKEKPFKCDKCDMHFSLKGNLRRHKMIHSGERPHICTLCGKGFIQATSLQMHIQKHHKDSTKPSFACQVCGRVFVRLMPYQLHMKKQHGSKFEIEQSDSHSMDMPKLEFKCQICGREFAKLMFLKRHESRHGEKTFLCSDCGKGFVRKADLQSHVKVHTGEKPHQCTICNKSFAHAGSLVTHSLVHSGYKPFNCDTCSKSFSQLSHLKVHQRTHSGERPYSCTYCGKTFSLKSNLTVHIRTHTGETPYICAICGKGFYDSSSMKKHKSIHFSLSGANVKDETIEYFEMSTTD